MVADGYKFIVTIANQIASLLPGLRELRHDLHVHPELGFDLSRTVSIVRERLMAMGLKPREHVNGSGLTALIGDGGPVIALRADMDALPILEETGLPYASGAAGKMHACGHDGHTTMLLGAAEVLAKNPPSCTVKLIFQPAEENVEGAKAMIADGALEDPAPEAVFGLHGWPGLPLGTIGLREGAIMASSDRFDAVVKGKGGHAAHPEGCVDPIVVAAHLIAAWQTIVSRQTSPVDPAVVTVTRMDAGSAYNIIPPEARLCGTWRTVSPALRKEIPLQLDKMGRSLCEAFGATLEFSCIEGTAVTMNDPKLARFVGDTAKEAFGEERVRWVDAPSMGAEDFGCYAEKAPGCFFWLGLGDRPFCHNPKFDFADEALPVGIEMFVRIARGYRAMR
jgi:amidohydrolase